MCRSCWSEAGHPRIWNERVGAASASVKRLEETHAVGGSLHIVTDDWNVDDEHLAFCSEFAERERGGFDEVERECYDAMRVLSVDERYSALAHADGFWNP